jgi:hypothetical protein
MSKHRKRCLFCDKLFNEEDSNIVDERYCKKHEMFDTFYHMAEYDNKIKKGD